jgi:CheY-like chemotaxis protein
MHWGQMIGFVVRCLQCLLFVAQFESAGIAGQGTTFYFDLPIFKVDETGELVYNASKERVDKFPAGSHRMVGVALQSKSSKVAPDVVSMSHELPITAELSSINICSSESATSEPHFIVKGSAMKSSLRRQLLAPLNTYLSTNTVSSSTVGSFDEGSTSDRAFCDSDHSPPVKVIRILLVDDIAINRKMVRKMLEAEPSLRGCIIFEVEDGTDAVAFVARSMVSMAVDMTTKETASAAEVGLSVAASGTSRKVGVVADYSNDGDVADAAIEFPQLDCIFMDSVMKLMHGPETVITLRRDLGYRGPIIGLTGNAMPEDIKVFMKSGLDEILIKPVKKAALLGALISAGVLPRS